MQKYHDVVLDNKGNAVLGATITVTNNSDGTAATIYSDNGTTTIAGGTFTSSSVDGAYSFYAANGRYDIAITKTGFTTESLTDVLLFDQANGLVLPQENDAVTPTLSFGDGDTGYYEIADDDLGLSIGGVLKWRWLLSSFRSATDGGPEMVNQLASSTNPVFNFSGDGDTGVGKQADDNLSLISGGLEGVRVEDPADLAATETSLWVYDLDNATMEQVTVGAADSGGSGFKYLRIAN